MGDGGGGGRENTPLMPHRNRQSPEPNKPGDQTVKLTPTGEDRAGTEDGQPPGVAAAVPKRGGDTHGGDGGAGGDAPLLDILADLALQALPPLLQLLDGALLGELIGRRAHLALGQRAAEQLLCARRVTSCARPQLTATPRRELRRDSALPSPSHPTPMRCRAGGGARIRPATGMDTGCRASGGS